MNKPFTMLLTGLSGAGKSTIAQGLKEKLDDLGIMVQILDGDIIRSEIGQLFGYSREERNKMSKVIRTISKILNQNGISVIVATISPYQEMREMYRREISSYIEVYVECPLNVCMERDVKGLYKKALNGDIINMVGIDDVFEVPDQSDLIVNTSLYSREEVVKKIMDHIYV